MRMAPRDSDGLNL